MYVNSKNKKLKNKAEIKQRTLITYENSAKNGVSFKKLMVFVIYMRKTSDPQQVLILLTLTLRSRKS